MSTKRENEELHSRRDFFKKATQKAVPFIAAITLASSPLISNAVNSLEKPNDCSSSCSFGCSSSCTGSCSGSCKGSCYGKCKGSCGRSCSFCCDNGK